MNSREPTEDSQAISRLETLPLHSTDLLTLLDEDGTIQYESPAIEQVYGFGQEALVGEQVADYFHPEDRGRVMEAFRTLVDADEYQVESVTYRHEIAAGGYKRIESVAASEPTPEGYYVVNSRDISNRETRTQQFRALAEEYRTLLETVDDGIFFLSVDTTASGYEFEFERVNQAFEDITGITTPEVRGKSPTAVFGDDLGADLKANYRQCADDRESIRYEEKVPIETEARYWQTTLTPVVTNDEVTQIIGVTRNVSERVERERQLRSKNDQLDEFASVISHDIRNPLGVAQGRVELLDNEHDSEHLPPIIRALDRIDELVSDTLTLARQGQAVSETEPIPLINLVGSCWKTVETHDATIAIDDEITIRGDQSRLQHVFENLFRNAIEHGGDDVTVRVGQFADRGIYVENSGPPIPADKREEVFDAGHTSASGGTGFGLTIVKRIAEAHGWQIDITEGSDGGARFEFTGVEIDER